VGRSVVNHWLSGRNKPSPKAAPLLAHALDTTVLELCGRTSDDADLVDLRIVHGLNAVEAARAAGITPTQMADLEQAVSMPNPDYLDALAPVYETSVDDIHRAWVNRRVRLFPGSLEYLDDAVRHFLSPWADHEPAWAEASGDSDDAQ
jgi:transcriptional regulator with XRE-family HTH domain